MTKDDFSQKVLDSEQMLYRLSMSMLKNNADCEDAVQQTILTAYKKLSSLKNEEFFRTWITRILINECNKILKKRNRTAPIEVIENRTDDTFIHNIEIKEAIISLSPKLRVVILMKYSEGFSITEISKALKIPEGTVKSRLSQAKKKLKEIL
ncbi:MAG: RNA polymerase sigma factor [Clostridia bacterium]|nr:RNA polymerase sigma factor [Clostridia bacterium]